ncbi:MAG: PHP domain-containing protein, partial [Eubacteriales bacterium]|nr:PHP domain-containing protein [Eubacteriales bacterium]
DMPVETEAFLRKREFDFVIGSIHFLPDGADIYKLPYASEEEVDAMFRQYFASMLDLARMGGFDSLAHLDYPLRVLRGKVREASVLQYRDLIEPILEETAHRQIALEINTRGTYDWQKRVGPEKWAVKRFRELGGKYVTIGSDAHTASLLGEGFDQAVALLSACGYDAYTIYRERKPVRIALRDDKEEMIAHVG